MHDNLPMQTYTFPVSVKFHSSSQCLCIHKVRNDMLHIHSYVVGISILLFINTCGMTHMYENASYRKIVHGKIQDIRIINVGKASQENVSLSAHSCFQKESMNNTTETLSFALEYVRAGGHSLCSHSHLLKEVTYVVLKFCTCASCRLHVYT